MPRTGGPRTAIDLQRGAASSRAGAGPRERRVLRLRGALVGLAGASLALFAGAPAASAATECTKYVAPGGSDDAPGTTAQPLATPQKLADSLSAGQTGCFRTGVYVFTNRLKVARGGGRGAPVTFRSQPGERARLVGRIWIAEGADHVTFAELDLDGTNPNGQPSPTVNANDATFRDNDVTNNHTGESCFLLGSPTWGHAARTVIERNRIHDCGRLPATNFDHGIYVEDTTDAKIADNLIYDNADYGVHLYPNAQRTHVTGNVIDGNGEGVTFSGEHGKASSGNVVEHNVITNSKLRHNVESWFPAGNPVGRGNVARRNCIHGGARDRGNGGIQNPTEGFTATGNVIEDPRFANRAAKDFRLREGSPCRGVLDGSVPGPTDAPTSAPAPAAGELVQPASAVTVGGRAQQLDTGRPASGTRPARLVLKGGVSTSKVKRGRRVVIQVKRNGKWRTIARRRLTASGRFSSRARVRLARGARFVRLRAVVPAVGRSSIVRLRVRR